MSIKFACLASPLRSSNSPYANIYNIRDLTNARRQRQRKQHLKMYFFLFVLFEVKKENEKFPVLCSRSPQNLEFGHFTLLLNNSNVREMYQNLRRMCRAIVFAH